MRILAMVLFGNLIFVSLFLFYYSDLKDLREISLKNNILLGCINIVITILGASYETDYITLVFFLLFVQGILLVLGEKQMRQLRKVLRFVLYFLSMLIAEILGVHFFWKYLERTGLTMEEYCQNVVLSCLLGMCLLSVLGLYICQFLRSKTKAQKGIWMLVSIKMIQEIFILHASVLFTFSNETYFHDVLIYIPFLLVDYLIYAMLVFKYEEKRIQTQREDMRAELNEYYVKLETEYKELRKLYHDMNNKLAIYEKSPELNGMMDPFIDKLNQQSQFYHTGSPQLDLLLFNGRRVANDNGIQFHASVPEGMFSKVNEEDLGTIMSNAMMNAIEACEKIKDGPKEIRIEGIERAGKAMLYIRNTTSKEREKGSFITDKLNKKFHGIGMSSIRNAVEKNDGCVQIMEEDQSFLLSIMFG